MEKFQDQNPMPYQEWEECCRLNQGAVHQPDSACPTHWRPVALPATVYIEWLTLVSIKLERLAASASHYWSQAASRKHPTQIIVFGGESPSWASYCKVSPSPSNGQAASFLQLRTRSRRRKDGDHPRHGVLRRKHPTYTRGRGERSGVVPEQLGTGV